LSIRFGSLVLTIGWSSSWPSSNRALRPVVTCLYSFCLAPGSLCGRAHSRAPAHPGPPGSHTRRTCPPWLRRPRPTRLLSPSSPPHDQAGRCRPGPAIRPL
jgi:hypothetical protein